MRLVVCTVLVAGCAFLHGASANAQAGELDPLAEPVEVPVEPPDLLPSEPTFAYPKTDFPDPKGLEPALGKGLETKDGFCKNEDYELTFSERRLCHLASAAAERCPGFVKACEKTSSGGSGTGSRARRLREGDGDGGVRWGGSPGPLGAIVGGILQVVFWAVIVVGLAAMLWAIVSALVGRKRDAKSDRNSGADKEPVHVPLLTMTGTPEELLARARELALAGSLEAAMSVLLRAFLRHLEIGGRLELHPSRTNGDYARSLRRHGHDTRELRRLAAEVEAVEFGGARPTPEAFSALHGHVARLVQATGLLVVLVFLGTLTGCEKRPPPEGTVNSCGAGANGYSALCQTLAARGATVRRRFTSIQAVANEVTQVVVLDDDLEDAERKVLLDWVDQGGRLVVFDRVGPYDGRLASSEPCGDELVLDPEAWNLPADATLRFRLPEARAFSNGSRLFGRVHATCHNQAFALELLRGEGIFRGEGRLVAVADRRIATNAGLAIGENAALVAGLVGPRNGTVELVGAWTGTGSDLPVESLSRSGLLPWFLQILAFGFAIALYRGAPFGSRREPVTVTRRAFAEHARALGDGYARARASRQALVNFGSWALERLRVRLAATKLGKMSDLASAVAARHSVSEAEVMSLVVAVRSAEDQAHDSASESEHLAALRRLSALVKKTGGSS